MTDEYPSNSHKKKQEQERPRQQKIISGEARKKKPSLSTRISEAFYTPDREQSIGQFILFDVILPGLKDLLFDTATRGLEETFYHGGTPRGRSTSGGVRKHTNYNAIGPRRGGTISAASYARDPEVTSAGGRVKHDFNSIVLSSRGEAEQVLDRMIDIISDYDVATVSDLYDLVGMTETSSDFTNQRWGWDNLSTSTVLRVRDGYVLKLPRPIVLD